MAPDQLASQKPADLGLLCFQNSIYQSLALLGQFCSVTLDTYVVYIECNVLMFILFVGYEHCCKCFMLNKFISLFDIVSLQCS